LKVAGSVISDVTTVPFYYGYSLPEEQTEGELKLELTVWGETGHQRGGYPGALL
jgi:hypothetical protein